MPHELQAEISAIDRQLILATQAGLPLVPRPYDEVGRQVGISGEEVRRRLADMLQDGRIRRIGLVPNHYALGYKFNGMSVWDVDDAVVDSLGMQVGALHFVSHCYRRPRHLPLWPYNLFAMVHARSEAGALADVERIAELLGPACRSHEVLFSTRILKKTGFRISA